MDISQLKAAEAEEKVASPLHAKTSTFIAVISVFSRLR
jgi:hypothetical protein